MKNNIYKFFLILVVNLIFIFILIGLFNYYVYYRELKSIGFNSYEIFSNYIYFLKRDISENNRFNNMIEPDSVGKENIEDKFRKVENRTSDKQPIILFGCSFVYGSGLNDNETLSFELAAKTGRPVYNRAKNGWGVQHMLYQLKNEEFYNIIPKPQYIIYVYFDGHLTRMSQPITVSMPNCYYVFYNEKNKNYYLKRRTFFTDKIIFQHFLANQLDWNFLNKINGYNNKQYNRLFNYILESKKEAEKHWDNDVQFVVLMYSEINDDIKNRLKETGIEVISKEDFKIDVNDEEYTISKNNTHPNAKAWDIIIPIIIDKLKINKSL